MMFDRTSISSGNGWILQPMLPGQKIASRRKLGLALQELLRRQKQLPSQQAISSLRRLAASSGVEYAIVQKIATGQKDPQYTTLLAIAEGLGISLSEWIDLAGKQELSSTDTGKTPRTEKK